MSLNRPSTLETLKSIIINTLLAYVAIEVCRWVYFAYNHSYFTALDISQFLALGLPALLFHTPTVLYLNGLILILLALPLPIKERGSFYKVVRWIYVTVNSLGIVLNLMDTVYFAYTNQRTTWNVFNQFSNESNLGRIFATEMLRNWYLVLLAIIMGWALYRLFYTPHLSTKSSAGRRYYTDRIILIVLLIPVSIAGIRGGFTTRRRPLSINEANPYVKSPLEVALVVNTPFSMIRTIGDQPFKELHYFPTQAQAQAIFNPIHQPRPGAKFRPRPVVVIILESFGMEYWGAFNQGVTFQGKPYGGFTPFLDSIVSRSLVFERSFANGRKSVDAMPSVLSSMPKVGNHVFLTSAASNYLPGLASELSKKGYETAFFHGAPTGSMGFNGFAAATGFQHYYGLSDYTGDRKRDYDGFWSIWDEEFLQYMAQKLNQMQGPFMATVFTATSHHPYVVPERYKGKFPEGTLPMHKCVGYTDYALKKFFSQVEKQPWYHDALFVITGDHTGISALPQYQTAIGVYRDPVIFFTPDGSLSGRNTTSIAQQVDVMPTVLSFLGYDRPFIAFGQDLLSTPAEDTFAVNENAGIFQIIMGDYVLQYDLTTVRGYYNYRTDPMLKHNLMDKADYSRPLRLLQAYLQQYMHRVISNQMVLPAK